MSPKIIQFQARRSLLNPGFEGYKLSPDSQDDIKYYPISLPSDSLEACSYLDQLSELQTIAYRMELNGLAHNPFRPFEALYFDVDHALWTIQLEEEEVIEQLIPPPDEPPSSYPSVTFLSEDIMLFIHGDGKMLTLLNRDTGDIDKVELPAEFQGCFCRIEASHLFATQKDKQEGVEGGIGQDAKQEIKQDPKQNPERDLEQNPEQDIEQNATFHAKLVISRLVRRGAGQKHCFMLHTFDLFYHGNQPTAKLAEVAMYVSKSRPLKILIDSEGLIIGANTLPFDIETGAVKDHEPISMAKANGLYDIEEASDQALFNIILVKYSHEDPVRELWQTTDASYLGPYIDHSLPREACSVTIAEADDALAYSIHQATAEHIRSFDALSFIQAGKRDRRYSLFVPEKALIVEASQLVYIYEQVQNRTSKTARQFLVRLDSNESMRGWSVFGDATLVVLARTQIHLIRF